MGHWRLGDANSRGGRMLPPGCSRSDAELQPNVGYRRRSIPTSVLPMRRFLISALVVATAFGLVGCSAGATNYESTTGYPAPDMAPSMPEAGRDEGTNDFAADGDTESGPAQ